MKFYSIILVLFITAFTTKPLLSNMIHHKLTATEVALECCEHCSGECCGDQSEDSCDTSAHDCSQDCSCLMDGVVVFTRATSPQIQLFGTVFGKMETRYISYQFSLPPIIWHPPQHG